MTRLWFHRTTRIKSSGEACLSLLVNYYFTSRYKRFTGKLHASSQLKTNLTDFIKQAENLSLKVSIKELTSNLLQTTTSLPVVLCFRDHEYIIVKNIKKNKKYTFYSIIDPVLGQVTVRNDAFEETWLKGAPGLMIFLEPNNSFRKSPSVSELFSQLQSKRYVLILILLISLALSLLGIFIPILNQKIVDIGIKNRNTFYIFTVLVGQLSVYLSQAFFNLINSRLFMGISISLNKQILKAFLGKLVRLPIRHFDNTHVTDISQRVTDFSKIERFLTSSSASILFTLLNLLIYLILITIYNFVISMVFIGGSLASFFWLLSFLRKRKDLENAKFRLNLNSSSLIHELIYGMREIKMNGAEKSKLDEWEIRQTQINNINREQLMQDQKQTFGNVIINQCKTALVIFYMSYLIIHSRLTLGEMVSISFMIGQLNAPFFQLIEFSKVYQDANLSMRRINEVQQFPDEDEDNLQYTSGKFSGCLDKGGMIVFKNVNFKYDSTGDSQLFHLLNLEIILGKTIAFVGNSGSGKTTLLKLLLKFYEPDKGEILINDVNLSTIPSRDWRKKIGVVMQDAYIFSSTIGKNIALDADEYDLERIRECSKLANLDLFIEELPLKYDTVIDSSSTQLSGGQIQRILIARALYKNPEIIIFDEATSSLDTHNEATVMKNLFNFSKLKTLIIVAHRLSTVRSADCIFVLDQGKIVEMGNHKELVKKQGQYYRLVVNQLEQN